MRNGPSIWDGESLCFEKTIFRIILKENFAFRYRDMLALLTNIMPCDINDYYFFVPMIDSTVWKLDFK